MLLKISSTICRIFWKYISRGISTTLSCTHPSGWCNFESMHSKGLTYFSMLFFKMPTQKHATIIYYNPYINTYLAFANYGRVTTTACTNYCGSFYLIHPACQLSLWEKTGVPGENPRLSAER